LLLLLGQLTVAGLVVATAWAMTTPKTFAREPLLLTWATSAVLLGGVRIALHTRDVGSRLRSSSLRPTLIVGAGGTITAGCA
jgi:FlaA1/EpsC-like NDP-sugar epimerase